MLCFHNWLQDTFRRYLARVPSHTHILFFMHIYLLVLFFSATQICISYAYDGRFRPHRRTYSDLNYNKLIFIELLECQ